MYNKIMPSHLTRAAQLSLQTPPYFYAVGMKSRIVFTIEI